MINLVKKLCNLSAASGNEDTVREFILNEISPYCEAYTDQNGNIIAFKKGKKTPNKKIMLDAHMDEVGVIVTSVTESGLLRFETVGGILTESLLGATVRFKDILGVIGIKPIHLCDKDEKKALPKPENLFIDIGAKDKEDALKYVSLGEIGSFKENFTEASGGRFISKAIDDRIGCALLITLIKEKSEYDFYATFTVSEELGLRGAKTAAYTVSPDIAIVLEATTAADINGAPIGDRVCEVSGGAVISFMDNSTLYNRQLFDKAFSLANKNNIKLQAKEKVAGGNNSGAISLSKGGVKTITVSLPCRYIHSPSSLADISDAENMLGITRHLVKAFAIL